MKKDEFLKSIENGTPQAPLTRYQKLKLIIFTWVLLSVVKSGHRRYNRLPDHKKNPKKYRKVIKEGLFFDRTEWHER